MSDAIFGAADPARALSTIRSGGKRAVARALAMIETRANDANIAALLDAAHAAPRGSVIGLTGPPGVGKSSLTNELVARWRAAGLTVAVVAVDPSSAVSGGALLGDRTRIRTDPDDQGVFIRSLASRGALGGLTDLAYPTTVLLRALFDRVLVETVGVGQSEADIADLADTVVLCVQPASGDSLQFMKAGIMEIPDIAVVTKADLGDVAERAVAELKGALSLSARAVHAARGGTNGLCANRRVLAVSAHTGAGLDELAATLADHSAATNTDLTRRRARQADAWLKQSLRDAFGQQGLDAIGNLPPASDQRPFTTRHEIGEKFQWGMRA